VSLGVCKDQTDLVKLFYTVWVEEMNRELNGLFSFCPEVEVVERDSKVIEEGRKSSLVNREIHQPHHDSPTPDQLIEGVLRFGKELLPSDRTRAEDESPSGDTVL